MKVVWDAEEELSLMEIVDRVNTKYDKEWKPQTVSTFLARLVRKEYLQHNRQGRQYFYKILVPLEEYKGQLTNDYIEFWNHGNADEFLESLIKERKLRKDEIERISGFIEKHSNMQNVKKLEKDSIELFSIFRKPAIEEKIIIHDLKEINNMNLYQQKKESKNE